MHGVKTSYDHVSVKRWLAGSICQNPDVTWWPPCSAGNQFDNSDRATALPVVGSTAPPICRHPRPATDPAHGEPLHDDDLVRGLQRAAEHPRPELSEERRTDNYLSSRRSRLSASFRSVRRR